ncbi:MAG: hypothetical protein IT210_09975 [Armatimonadetes bacterium]|nr:hypothetical protein [Armatimonadota bacterium]
MQGKFPLGKLVVTRSALEAVQQAGNTPWEFLDKHQNADWGELEEFDWHENNDALLKGKQIRSSYMTASGQRIWIITEADRSQTTMLLPTEY